MKNMDSILDCEIYRRVGIELEANTPSGEIKRLSKNEAPEGAQYIGALIHDITKERVEIHGWHNTHNNNCWIIKPDSSCGVEICTPILKGWTGLKSLLHVIDGMKGHVSSDGRCSLHAHVNVSDLSIDKIASVISWWIKCELVFMDLMPERRKCNRYCQLIGLSDFIDIDSDYDPELLIELLADQKYYSINTFHLRKDRRKTLEFRFMGNEGCIDSYTAKNWIRLILYFVEVVSVLNMPKPYEYGNQWSSFCWLDPIDVFDLLGFDNPKLLSPGLKQVRDWTLCRLLKNVKSDLIGIWSQTGRKVAISQIEGMYNGESLPLSNEMQENLYSDRYAI